MPAPVPIIRRVIHDCSQPGQSERLNEVLIPGDLIFVMAGPKGTGAIRGYQDRAGYPEEACSATHVALVSEKKTLIHAVAWQGCIEGKLDYIHGRRVAIGRWDAAGREAVVDALLEVARQYVVGQRPYEMGRMFRAMLTKETAREPFVCSTFVNAVFRSVMGSASPLHDARLPLLTPFVCPAHLFQQPGLRDP